MGVLALEEEEEEKVRAEPVRRVSGQLASTSEIVDFSSTDQLAAARSPAVSSSIPDVSTVQDIDAVVSKVDKDEEVITSNSPDNREIPAIHETVILAPESPSFESAPISTLKSVKPHTKSSSPPVSILHTQVVNEPHLNSSRPTSPISRPITPTSRQITPNSSKAATPASVPAIEEMPPIRITTSDLKSTGSVSPPLQTADYQIALCPGDQLALSPGNQQVLDMLVRQHSQPSSPLASQQTSPLASQHASPQPSRPTSEPEDNQSLESYAESEEAEESEQSEVQRDLNVAQIAENIVEEVLLEREEKTQLTEDLYSNSDSEDLVLPPDEDEEILQNLTPG